MKSGGKEYLISVAVSILAGVLSWKMRTVDLGVYCDIIVGLIVGSITFFFQDYNDFKGKVIGIEKSLINNVLIGESLSKNELYTKFSQSIKSAKREILLTSFYDKNPEKTEVKEQKEYFRIIHDVSLSKKIKINRIVSIPSQEKLDWVLELLDRYEGIDTYNLRYIKFNQLNLEGLPMPLNLQIIDDEEVFIINPLEGFNSRDRSGKGLYFKNTKLVNDVFCQCYNKLWHESESSGILMSNGEVIDINKINLIKQWR